MTWRNTHERYGSLSIALHWSMLVLLAATYACIELRGQFLRGSGGRALIVQFHFMLGLSVGLLVWLRLLARSLGATPRIVPPLPVWQTRLASLMHAALYALMIGLPLLGWLILSAQNRPIVFWGIELPHLIAEDRDLGGRLQEWHMRIAGWGYWLIALHAGLGLAHHYLRGDNTLRRMLPKRD
ncbi:cytochrome b [Pseudomonas rhizosphaerae]|jgi:cytochrome b561|uniref:cytochrome b n=1 Tax=Pseudomonas rhizosphaerae TaxID=216142 RepID=UPI00177BA3D4|nr:cytochrome b [Pseudomonas rhizosphaerae]MBD8612491.1 cytochrome b [Pseudomonas putida]MEB2869207.1 cytochrome b [Pseudomonas rhizosphaerae]